MLKPSNMEVAAAEKQSKEDKKKLEEIKETIDCFRPFDKSLYLDTLSIPENNSFKNYILVLNKFMVVENHLLVFPEEFGPQTNHMTATDFCAVLTTRKSLQDQQTKEDNWLTFYNRGIFSGCSQPHQHFQMVPIRKLDNNKLNFFLPEVLDAAAQQQHSGDLEGCQKKLKEVFPFKVGFKELISISEKQQDVAKQSAEVWGASQDLLEKLGKLHDGPNGNGNGLIVRCGEEKHYMDLEATVDTSYNLLFTKKWMLIVPRRQENYAGVSVNALGFMFSFFAKDENYRELMVANDGMGCMELLKKVTFPLE